MGNCFHVELIVLISYLDSVQSQLYHCTLFRSQSFGLLSSHVFLQDRSISEVTATAVITKEISFYLIIFAVEFCLHHLELRQLAQLLGSIEDHLSALRNRMTHE